VTTEVPGAIERAAGLLAPLGAAVRAGRVSAEELVRESLGRIEAAADLGAVVAIREESIADARAIDARVARGEDPGPLAGLPLLVKDLEDVAGMRTTFGSLLYADAPPAERDGLIPGRLRAAGAVVVGKTNTPEFAYEGYTDNRVFGPTVNPWRRDISPGGSSGGSGAALAAGLAPIATASDGGGSIRIPASLCGLVGIKPTNGVVGRRPIPQWSDLSTDGPLGQTVADLRLLLSLEAGPVAGDPSTQVAWRLAPSAMPRRILAAPRPGVDEPLGADTAELFEAVLRGVEAELGQPVERLEARAVFPSGYDPSDWFVLAAVEQFHALGAERLDRERDRLDPAFAHWMDLARRIGIERYLGARRRRFDHILEIDELLGDDAVLLTPSLTVAGWSPSGVLPGRTEPGLPSSVFNSEPFNITGSPAMSVPAGLHANGVPFGLQVAGPRFREELVFGFAEAWERARPWPLVAPGYEPFWV
jgi:Asp-tRNA(Asn)/Glu-tRNA(Gln) amidotransferase A subunit family amidase